ncbi:MAG: DUF3795 domain-containing protein [Candidatus Hodarchaeales archaeon]|jgi:hypothetical protein
MLTEIAYCGLTCTECPAYIAKLTNDQNIREKTAMEWSKGNLKVSAEQINCDGCHAQKNIFIYCENCDIRQCGLEKEITTCTECSEYPCSEKLEQFWQNFNLPLSKTTLDDLHNSMA